MKIFTETVGSGSATLTCYVQTPSDELATARVRPLVLVLPGGGYFFTSDREAEPIALAYLAEGFNACVLRYSTGPDAPWSQSFADGRAALAWVREHAGDLGIDPAKVAAVGFSAGGHLAASLGTGSDDKPDALVLGYPVTLGEFGPPVGKEILDVPSAVTAQTPPTFLFSTCGDTTVPIRNSLALLSALAEAGVAFESHIYLLGPHGLSLAKPLTANGGAAMVEPSVAPWLTDSVRFLRAVFGDFAVTGEAETYRTLVERRRFGLDMPFGRLAADDRAVEVLQRLLPEMLVALQANGLMSGMSLRQLVAYRPEAVPAQTLPALAAELEALNG